MTLLPAREPLTAGAAASLAGAMFDRLSQNLARYGAGSAEQIASITRQLLGGPQRTFAPGADLVQAGSRRKECLLILQGLTSSSKLLPDGRRQIVGFHIPGELCDTHGLWLPMDYGVTAISRTRTVAIPHATLIPLLAEVPSLGHALWRWTLVEGAIAREWLVGLGRRTAAVRIAHFLCELRVRYQGAAAGQEPRLQFPLTQTHLADALGLSVVHVNRSLQHLRTLQLISLHHHTLLIHDWEALVDFGGFDAEYLRLEPGRSWSVQAASPRLA